MESSIERQAIRAAVALAAASGHGQSPEVIADLRDEAVQLIELFMRGSTPAEEVRVWCDDVASLMARLVSAGSIPEEHILPASAAVLRLRLAAARSVIAAEKKARIPASPKKQPEPPKPEPIQLSENQRKVVSVLSDHPGIRSKDLVATLAGTFSSRTVKRYVAELVSLGVIRRVTLPDGGVSYSLKS